MRRTTTLLATCLLLAAAAGCSDDGGDKAESKSTKKAAASVSAAATPEKLQPVWGPKLDEAVGSEQEATSACRLPSSNACGRYVNDIMEVVRGLEEAIEGSGKAYPSSTEQIEKMTEAESEYLANGCQGDPTADDPNSLCHGGALGVTIGAVTLDMTLTTDEIGM